MLVISKGDRQMQTFKVEIFRTNVFGEISSDARAFRCYEITAKNERSAEMAAMEKAVSEKGMAVLIAARLVA